MTGVHNPLSPKVCTRKAAFNFDSVLENKHALKMIYPSRELRRRSSYFQFLGLVVRYNVITFEQHLF